MQISSSKLTNRIPLRKLRKRFHQWSLPSHDYQTAHMHVCTRTHAHTHTSIAVILDGVLAFSLLQVQWHKDSEHHVVYIIIVKRFASICTCFMVKKTRWKWAVWLTFQLRCTNRSFLPCTACSYLLRSCRERGKRWKRKLILVKNLCQPEICTIISMTGVPLSCFDSGKHFVWHAKHSLKKRQEERSHLDI